MCVGKCSVNKILKLKYSVIYRFQINPRNPGYFFLFLDPFQYICIMMLIFQHRVPRALQHSIIWCTWLSYGSGYGTPTPRNRELTILRDPGLSRVKLNVRIVVHCCSLLTHRCSYFVISLYRFHILLVLFGILPTNYLVS